MQRIIVMGAPGSGKSTLARSLGAGLSLPVFHLDQAYWRPGWVQAPEAAFRAEVERIAALPAWVIDGNYTITLEPRFRRADTIVSLYVPRWLAMLRIGKRIVTTYGRTRPDLAPGCPEQLDLAFLRYAWSWNARRRARNLATIERFPGRRIVLRTKADQNHFVADLTRQP